jgi:2-amino-4-hydroxy-6-hydroxymethyldihydropteridine diphosphokinase
MICFLGLGSNLGKRSEFIADAINRIAQLPDTELLKKSSELETRPVGYLQQPDFINCVIKLKTDLNPEELLQAISVSENEMGRKREIHWGPRNIDIDILLYNNKIIDLPHLSIPHKELHKRMFVLKPLMEIEPELLHPVLNKTIKELKEELCQELGQ